MGFWNKVAKIVTAPQKLYATVVKKIGDKMSESYKAPIFKMGWKLQDAAEWLTPKCYKTETATVSKVVDISSDCQKYFNKAKSEVSIKLAEIIDEAKTDMVDVQRNLLLYAEDSVFDKIKDLISNVTFDEEKQKVYNEISRIISIDDAEFRKKLEIIDDDKRSKECSEYVTENISNIVLDFAKQIATIKNKTIIVALELVKNSFLEKKNSLIEVKKQKEKLLLEKDNPDFTSLCISNNITDISYTRCVLSILSDF